MANLTCEEKDMVASVSAFLRRRNAWERRLMSKMWLVELPRPVPFLKLLLFVADAIQSPLADTTAFPLEKSHLSGPKLEDPESM